MWLLWIEAKPETNTNDSARGKPTRASTSPLYSSLSDLFDPDCRGHFVLLSNSSSFYSFLWKKRRLLSRDSSCTRTLTLICHQRVYEYIGGFCEKRCKLFQSTFLKIVLFFNHAVLFGGFAFSRDATRPLSHCSFHACAENIITNWMTTFFLMI